MRDRITGRAVANLAAVGTALLLGWGAAAGEASFSVELEAGAWKALRVQKLPQGALVTVSVETDGLLAIAMVDSDGYRRYPDPPRPLFRGRTERSLAFSVITRGPGDHYVVLDNRDGTESRSVGLVVGGSRSDGVLEDGRSSDRPTLAARLEETEVKLGEFEEQLGRVFIFDRFPIHARECGGTRVFAEGEGVVLCHEYAVKLFGALEDKRKASDALLFVLFHELGHSLLKQWKSPFYDHEDVADEFATATLMMLGQRERLTAAIEFLAGNTTVPELLSKTFSDDRHSLSIQRARNILRWANDPSVLRKWQPLFVPHMQTDALEKLRDTHPSWSDAVLVEKELRTRESGTPSGG